MDIDRNIADEIWRSVFNELGGESERACAIVGAAYLDDLLLSCLQEYMLENPHAYDDLLNPDNAGAPLGGFGSRITTAYAIGLISETDQGALRKIKRVRNLFAHNLQLSFSEDSVSSHCRDLANIMEGVSYLSSNPSPREIFQTAIAFYAGKLGAALHLIRNFKISGGVGSVLRLSDRLSKALGQSGLNRSGT